MEVHRESEVGLESNQCTLERVNFGALLCRKASVQRNSKSVSIVTCATFSDSHHKPKSFDLLAT